MSLILQELPSYILVYIWRVFVKKWHNVNCFVDWTAERACEISGVCRVDNVKNHGEVYKEFTRKRGGKGCRELQALTKWCLL